MNQTKLLKVWEIISWFDGVRWNEEEMKSTLIPGRIYENLGDSQKILVHWLTYITDQQRPYQDVWMKGGPVFAEIVLDYANKPDSRFTILKGFTNPSDKRDGVDVFTSKTQQIDGRNIKYTPRFGMHILSISRTLHLLKPFQCDLVHYLSKHWEFIKNVKQNKGDNRVSRIAFLLYLLTYKDAKQGLVSLHRDGKKIEREIERFGTEFEKLLGRMDELENHFYRWSKGRDRYHKRLWAALRDYLKPNSFFRGHLIKAVEDVKNEEFKTFIKNEEEEILESLELPGDIWNLRFIEKIFKGQIESPKELREKYERLGCLLHFGKRFFPEQFDVSFSFSPSMCDEIMEDYCPFRVGSQIRKFCLHSMGIQKTNNLCPVAMITCGYRYYCRPEGCPIKDGIKENLCSGCSIKIGIAS